MSALIKQVEDILPSAIRAVLGDFADKAGVEKDVLVLALVGLLGAALAAVTLSLVTGGGGESAKAAAGASAPAAAPSSTSLSSTDGGKKGKKKNKGKKKKTKAGKPAASVDTAATAAPAAVAAPPASSAAPAVANASSGSDEVKGDSGPESPSKKKKKKKKKKSAAAKAAAKAEAEAAANAGAAKGSVIDADDDDDSDDEDDEQERKAREAAQKKKAKKKAKTPEVKVEAAQTEKETDGGGWSTVASPSRKRKQKKAAMAAANEKKKGADGAPAVAKVEGKVQVASNKLGRVIGSGGETINAIRSGSGCDIELPDRDRDDKNAPATVTINVSGPSADAVAACKKAIKDVTTKGYCEFTVGDDFEEGSVMVPPQYFSELIGAGGRVIRCIQEKVGARLNIPNFDRKKGKNGDADSKPKREKPMRVGITGTKAAVAAAKEIVREIMRNYHHEVTHPGVSHADVDVPEKFLNILIGPKGSNIKHIQNNWKVRVNIPNELSANRCVVIVGAAANCAAAKQYVLKMMEQSQEKKKETNTVLSQPGWGNGASGNGLEEGEIDPRGDDDDEEEGPHEEWMDDFAPPPGGIKVDLANGWGAPAETAWT